MQIEQLKPIIEAALLAASQPLGVNQLGELFAEEDAVDRTLIAQALEALVNDCAGRGVELREVASGFRYQVRRETHPWLARMWTEKPSRYSRALLETLALIAYRQPITRPEIEQIRGVVVSSNIIKTMEEREWIRVVGHRDVPGRPALFGTTRNFLDYFNLKSLDELPPLSEVRDMEDPQLRLPEETIPVRVNRELPIDPNGLDEPEPSAEDTSTPAEGIDETSPPPHQSDPLDNLIIIDEDTQTQQSPYPASTTDAHVESTLPTADEAANPAHADDGDVEQDTEEYRA